MFHHVRALFAGWSPARSIEILRQDYHDREKFATALGIDAVIGDVHTFRVDHDWGAVMGLPEQDLAEVQAQGDGPIRRTKAKVPPDMRLPFDRCAFEMRAPGIVLIIPMATSSEHRVLVTSGYVVAEEQVVSLNREMWPPDQHYVIDAIYNFAFRQVYGALLGLDADVVEIDPPKRDEKLAYQNAKRARKGHHPLLGFHVLRVPTRRVGGSSTVPYQGVVRLHWRRGHWRHGAPEARSWVRAHLVGNPDLGFIDKMYLIDKPKAD